MAEELPEITDDELEQRVLYSLLGAVAKFARVCAFPLKSVVGWLEVAYYHELSRQGLSQSQAADFFGVSTRKVSQLAARLKQNFLRPETEIGLPRKIEYMLWAEPLSEGRIRQSLRDYSDEEIEAALEKLVGQERVNRREGRTVYYEVSDSEFRLYQDNWLSRVDGLNNHLTNVVEGVYARFFEDEPNAFARTLNFRIKKDRVEELEALYQDVIFPRLSELDAEAQAAQDDEETIEMGLSINWTPESVDEDDDSID